MQAAARTVEAMSFIKHLCGRSNTRLKIALTKSTAKVEIEKHELRSTNFIGGTGPAVMERLAKARKRYVKPIKATGMKVD